MSAWKAKRFWKTVTVEACDGGFTIRLDNRAVKTPGKQTLVVPTLAMAQAIAVEWDEQIGAIKPETMPITRFANSAMEKVTPQFDQVVSYLAAYGETDLLCYRAHGPEDLVQHQAAGWDPLLGWCREDLKAPLLTTAGITFIEQPSASLVTLHAQVASFSPFQLSGFHDLVAISGSLVLALGVAKDRITAEQAFALSRIDEHWQAEQWGTDEDAAELEASKLVAIIDAHRFFGLCG
jgi:chaperone required for assembly of F1-ATPase